AARGEPGWADEARRTAATLRAPMAARLADLKSFNEARDAMLAGSGAPLDAAAVRRRPGMARRALLDALAAASTADEVRALAPMAAVLDAQSGNQDASRRVAAVVGRDMAVRARFQARVRALIAGKLDAAQRAPLVEELERGGEAVSDALVAVLLRMPASDAVVARLRRAAAADDAWLGLRIARVEAGLRASNGDRFGAERALLGTAEACRDRAWAMECGELDLDLAELYLPMRRLEEADRRMRAALVAYALEGRPDLEDYTLRQLANLERLRDRDWLAGAYLQEIRLRAQGATEVQRCDALRFAAESSAAIALAAGDVAAARAQLAEPESCSKPPTALWLIDAVALARLGNAGDRERAARWIAAAREASGSRPGAADIGEGRLQIDADPGAGAAKIRAGFAALAALRVEPGTVGELRGWGFAALISDAGKRGDWAGALALFAEDLGAAGPEGLPNGCLVAASIDDERATVVARGRDGALHGSHRTDLPLGPLVAGSIVPQALVAALAGCEAIAVVARPPLHGRADLLPAQLPWAFASGGKRGGARPSSEKRAVVVADAQPPVTLGLPPLAPIAAAGATVVSGAAATPTRVLAELADAGYVEIHAHGIADARDAAFLALSPDADGSFALTAAQVRKAALAGAPIVVLAACRSATTARYEAYRWSLPDAFLAAGARAVIASATAVPDDQGAALFAELRARIDRGEPPAQAVAALRAARVAAGQPWAAGLIVFE
ncbi:MAG TPA: CHAT domain-containing protein, partial [Kofleriaceae bacterium]|nr:CHAT domain-containing protein [Kofleriaceae bacterium]